jgi:hypothetical protein
MESNSLIDLRAALAASSSISSIQLKRKVPDPQNKSCSLFLNICGFISGNASSGMYC